jgi:hypothetical protein
MAGAHMFQAVQNAELDKLGLVAIRDFLKKRTRYLRLVPESNKADGVNITPITQVAWIVRELLENLIDMEKIDANSIDDCTSESGMEYLESAQERYASVTADISKPNCWRRCRVKYRERILRCITKAVADYSPLHRNLRLNFINGKP